MNPHTHAQAPTGSRTTPTLAETRDKIRRLDPARASARWATLARAALSHPGPTLAGLAAAMQSHPDPLVRLYGTALAVRLRTADRHPPP